MKRTYLPPTITQVISTRDRDDVLDAMCIAAEGMGAARYFDCRGFMDELLDRVLIRLGQGGEDGSV